MVFFWGIFGVQGSILSRVQGECIFGVSGVHIIRGLHWVHRGFRGWCTSGDFKGYIWVF